MEYWTLARSIFLAKEKWNGKRARSSIIIFDSESAFICKLDHDYLSICWSCLLYSIATKDLVISMDSVFLLIDIFILKIVGYLMPKEGLILKKIIKFFKKLKRRIDILNAEAELKFILENK